MATMNVSLPDPMKRWVEAQAENGAYANSSDYVRDLIRKDQEKRAKIAAMQEKIDEALAGGMSTMTLAEVREEARRRFEALRER